MTNSHLQWMIYCIKSLNTHFTNKAIFDDEWTLLSVLIKSVSCQFFSSSFLTKWIFWICFLWFQWLLPTESTGSTGNINQLMKRRLEIFLVLQSVHSILKAMTKKRNTCLRNIECSIDLAEIKFLLLRVCEK